MSPGQRVNNLVIREGFQEEVALEPWRRRLCGSELDERGHYRSGIKEEQFLRLKSPLTASVPRDALGS